MTTHTSKIDIKHTFSLAWGHFKKEWKVLVGMMLIVFVINSLPDLLGANKPGSGMVLGLFSLIISAVSIWLGYNLTKTYIRVARDHKVALPDMFEWGTDALKRLFFFFIASFLYSLAVVVGFIFLIVPGVYVGIRWLFAPYLVLDKQVKIGDAFTTSWNATKGHEWNLFLIGLVALGLCILAALTFGLGFLIVAPLLGLVASHLYIKLAAHHVGHVTHAAHASEASH